jgi:hypothetical protein
VKARREVAAMAKESAEKWQRWVKQQSSKERQMVVGVVAEAKADIGEN